MMGGQTTDLPNNTNIFIINCGCDIGVMKRKVIIIKKNMIDFDENRGTPTQSSAEGKYDRSLGMTLDKRLK